MSLLYKPKEEQVISVEFTHLTDKNVLIEFSSDCGKFGTDEALCGFVISPELLMKLLKEKREQIEII
jgi:hypothetical protein